MADLAKLVVRLEAESSKLTTELDKANRQLANFGKKTESAVSLAKKAFAGLSVALVATKLAAMTREVINTGDELNKMSQKVGLSVEQLSSLQYSAELSDVSNRQLETGLVRLNRTLGQTGTAGEKQRQILEALNVTSKDVGGVVTELADRFSGMEDGAVKTAIAVELFGKSGASLIPLLNAGADGLRKNEDELRRLGALMGGDVAQASEEYNDNITRLNTAFDGLKIKLASKALPAMVEFTNSIVRWLSVGGRVESIANRIAIAFEAMGVAAKIAGGFILGGLVGGPVGAGLGALLATIDEIADRIGALRAPQVATGRIERTPQAIEALRPKGVDEYTEALRKLLQQQDAAAEAERRQQEAARATQAAMEAAKAAQEQARQRIVDYVDALKDEQFMLTATREQVVAYEMAKIGADAPTIRLAQSIALETERMKEATEASKRWQEVRAELSNQVAEIAEGLRTEEEAIRETYARREQIVEQALEERIISEARAIELIAKLHTKEAEELTEALKKGSDDISEFAREAARNIQDALGDKLFDFMQGNFDNIFGSFKQMLDRMVAEALAAKIGEAIFGQAASGGAIGGFFGKILPSIAGAFGGGGNAAAGSAANGLNSVIASAITPRANGGPVFPGSAYLVGERGPELFTPATAGRINPDVGGGMVLNLNISGITDARGIRESAGQLAARVGTVMQRSMQRNT